jgi:excinuclease UvrABC ATPase subunit
MPDIKTALAVALARSQETVALKQTLDEWEDDEQRIRSNAPTTQPQTQPQQENEVKQNSMIANKFSVSNNVMRTTFNYIRDNKNSTRKSVLAALAKQGFKESSVNSVISQLGRSKQVHKNFDGTLHAINAEYKPIHQKKNREQPPASISNKLRAKIAAHKEATTKRVITVMKRKRKDPVQGIAALEVGTTATPFNLDEAAHELVRQSIDPKPWTPESVVTNLNVMQARQLYDYLIKVFGGYTL